MNITKSVGDSWMHNDPDTFKKSWKLKLDRIVTKEEYVKIYKKINKLFSEYSGFN